MTHIKIFSNPEGAPCLAVDQVSTMFGRHWLASKVSSFSHDGVDVHAATCGNDVSTSATIALASAVSKAYVRTRDRALVHCAQALTAAGGDSSTGPGRNDDDLNLFGLADARVTRGYHLDCGRLAPFTNMVTVYDRTNDQLDSHLKSSTAGNCVTFVHVYDRTCRMAAVFSVSRSESGAIIANALLVRAAVVNNAIEDNDVWLPLTSHAWVDSVTIAQDAIAQLMAIHFGSAVLEHCAPSDASRMGLVPRELACEVDYGGAERLYGCYDVIVCPNVSYSGSDREHVYQVDSYDLERLARIKGLG